MKGAQYKSRLDLGVLTKPRVARQWHQGRLKKHLYEGRANCWKHVAAAEHFGAQLRDGKDHHQDGASRDTA